MNLSDHLRPLLRDHDCVIIPDFGGLVAEYTPARVQPGGRHLLSPPTRQVAFNQALTRNDGLLVDALRQHLGLPAAEAREALRQAVAALHRDLQTQQRTELPGIGVFRQLAGRGLQFEYTGTDNLLTASFGLPELTAHPVSVIDARLAREQQAQLVPRLRSASRGLRLRRVVPGAAIGLLAGLAVAGLYLLNLHPAVLPTAWQGHLPRWEKASRQAVPQQAALAQPSFSAPEAVPVSETVPTPTAVTEKPEAAFVAAPAPVAPRQTDPVDALLSRRQSVPSPVPVRPKSKSRKVPAAAAIAVANESNIARPVPLAQRHAGAANMTTSYAVATAAPKPMPASVAPAAVATPVARPAVAVHTGKSSAAVPPKAVFKPLAKPAFTPASSASQAATTIKSRTGRYYLIIAAYGSLAHAEEGRRNLAHAGRPAKILLPPPVAAFIACRPSISPTELRQWPRPAACARIGTSIKG
ncbi:hypothetical protein [Hymenobacter sp. BRD67]|uniref:HU domain-containing protein n=1 Tax=Hymenobacter sp. BRD67 TaxID=2675877 RepID=UPI0015637115|nr:hypothetical protein [Hymenobacter sp. BRD67]QKG52460.1 hypothetical protein GKZ67_07395 [Hymenobacter sp. BRD67]